MKAKNFYLLATQLKTKAKTYSFITNTILLNDFIFVMQREGEDNRLVPDDQGFVAIDTAPSGNTSYSDLPDAGTVSSVDNSGVSKQTSPSLSNAAVSNQLTSDNADSCESQVEKAAESTSSCSDSTTSDLPVSYECEQGSLSADEYDVCDESTDLDWTPDVVDDEVALILNR